MKSLSYLLGLIVVILGVVVWDLNDKNNQLERTIYATQSREFSAATEKLSLLQQTISQSLLFEDEKALKSELDSIWRMSSDLRKSVANMPLHEEVQNDWMRYLGRIGDSAKKASDSGDLQNWKEKMTSVSTNLRAFSEEWNVATVAFYNNDGDYNKWTNNQQIALDKSPFVQVSKQLKTYNETDFPLTASESDYEKKRDLQNLKGEKITKKQAIQIFQTYFPNIEDAMVTVTKSKDDAPYPFYHIQFVRGSRIGYADITENSGHLLSFLLERPVVGKPLSHEEVLQEAQQFMKEVGYNDVKLTESRENHEAWHFVFTRQHSTDDALVYPDSIQVKVAKDNAEILGLNAMEYIQKETINEQAEIPIQWDSFFAKGANVEEVKKVYTENKDLQLRKGYEVLLRLDNYQHDTFRIVIDTESHEVMKVEKLQ